MEEARQLRVLVIAIPTVAQAARLGLTFSPLRTADLTDLLSDLLGMLCFWWLIHRLLANRRQEKEALTMSHY